MPRSREPRGDYTPRRPPQRSARAGARPMRRAGPAHIIPACMTQTCCGLRTETSSVRSRNWWSTRPPDRSGGLDRSSPSSPASRCRSSTVSWYWSRPTLPRWTPRPRGFARRRCRVTHGCVRGSGRRWRSDWWRGAGASSGVYAVGTRTEARRRGVGDGCHLGRRRRRTRMGVSAGRAPVIGDGPLGLRGDGIHCQRSAHPNPRRMAVPLTPLPQPRILATATRREDG